MLWPVTLWTCNTLSNTYEWIEPNLYDTSLLNKCYCLRFCTLVTPNKNWTFSVFSVSKRFFLLNLCFDFKHSAANMKKKKFWEVNLRTNKLAIKFIVILLLQNTVTSEWVGIDRSVNDLDEWLSKEDFEIIWEI